MPVPTEAAERAPASPSSGVPASPAETPASPGRDANGDGGGSTSPVDSLNGSQTEALEGSAAEEKPTKIFIGGLSWQTSVETLKEFFEMNFGEVKECNIMRDQATRKSRGFGFVTFSKAETVDKVLEAHSEDPIYIDDKLIDPKIAVPPKKVTNNRVHVKRIFVGGLSSDTAEDNMRDYFEQFGTVTEAQLMFDRNTNRHRGFGFVSFEAEEPAEKVCSIQFHDICGKRVEVKVAQTKEQMQCRGRVVPSHPSPPNYGYPVASFGPYYHGNYHFDMGMGYVPGPVMYPSVKMGRGGRRPDYHGPTYYGGYVDQRTPGIPGYFTPGPGGFSSIPMSQPMRGQPYFDPSHIIHNMEYIGDQFQGMALNSSYPAGGTRGGSYANGSNSPPYSQNITSYDPNNSSYNPSNGSYDPSYDPSNGGYAPGDNGGSTSSSGSGSYSPTQTASPTENGPASNGYTQVPAFTGNPQNSYAVAY